MAISIGTSASDSILGTSGDDLIAGLSGRDVLRGLSGDDVLAGNAFPEPPELNNSAARDTLFGGEGDDTLSGQVGNDQMAGGTGSDTLFGGAGRDRLNGGSGADVAEGGLSNDTYIVDTAADIIREAAGGGQDAVRSNATDYTLNSNVGEDDIERLMLTEAAGAAGATGNAQDNTLIGNSADNSLAGSDGDDVLSGRTGSDTLVGGSGDDSFWVDTATDVAIEQAGEGDDFVRSEAADYTLGTNIEELFIVESAGNAIGAGNDSDNSIRGNTFANTLDGGEGNDRLDGRGGADTMIGGSGNDRFYVDDLGDSMVENAGGGNDRAEISVDGYQMADSIETIIIARDDQDRSLFGSDSDERINGNSGRDLDYGRSGNDFLSGALGDDTLFGGDGDDEVYGRHGADVMYGGTGNDTLGGAVDDEVDLLYGGDGDDRLNLRLDDNGFGGSGDDLISVGSVGLTAGQTVDGGDGSDTLHISGGNPLPAGVVLIDVESVSFNGSDGNDSLVGSQVNDTITANSGIDVMEGGVGDDTLHGGDGDDTAVFSGSRSDYVITAGTGSLTVTDGSGTDGQDLVIDVEILQFADGTIDLGEPVRLLDSGTLLGTFASIQAGVDAAASGQTLEIAEGTYSESVTLDVALDIVGIGDVTVTPPSGSAFVVDGDLGAGNTLTFDNIDFVGADTSGIAFSTGDTLGTLEVLNAHFEANDRNGIEVSNGAGLGNIVVEDSSFVGNGQPSGSSGDGDILLFQYNGDGTLRNLTIEGQDRGLGEAETGIQFRSDTGAMGNVTIENVTISGIYEKQAIGIFNYDNVDNLVMNGVTVTADSTSFNTSINFDGIGGNIDFSNGAQFQNIDASGVDIISLQGDATSNSITGATEGEFLRGRGGDDALFGGDGNDTLVGDNLGSGSGKDTLEGGTGDDLLLGEEGSDTAVFSGSLDAASFAVSGSGDALVTTSAGGTDTLISVENLLFDDGGALLVGGGGFATIQAAVDAASAGDTIVVLPGTYNELVTIDKSLTILGQGDGSDPATSTIVVGGGKTGPGNGSGRIFSVNADDVTLSGMRIQDGDRGVELGNGFSNFNLTDSTIINTDIGLRTASFVQFDGITITDSTLDGNDYGIYFANDNNGSQIQNVTVTDSEFLNNLHAALYAETLETGNFTNITATDNASGNANGIVFDFWSNYATSFSNITFDNIDLTNPTTPATNAAFRFEAFGAASVSNITIQNSDVEDATVALFSNKLGAITWDSNTLDDISDFGTRGRYNAGETVNGDFLDDDNRDRMDAFGDSSHTFNGLSASDQLTGASGADDLDGGVGDDKLFGQENNDILDGGDGNDTAEGGLDQDTITGGSGNDVLLGEGEDLVALLPSFTTDFSEFDLGAIADGEEDWIVKSLSRDQGIVDLGGTYGQVFRMSSDPTSGDFAGPYSPAAPRTAGETTTTADVDTIRISYDFKAVSNTPDSSRLEVDFGIDAATDRNNFMVLEWEAGVGLRIAVNEPTTTDGVWSTNDFSAFTGNRTLIDGVDAGGAQWHNLEMVLRFVDGADNDVIDILLDGEHIGTTTTFENFRDWSSPDHAANAEANITSRLFFRPSGTGTPQDGPGGDNQGFDFDNLKITSYDSGSVHADSLIGGEGDDSLLGQLGDDSLAGGTGMDMLDGGEGNDTLDGGDGNDTHKGGIGDDRMIGGAGDDSHDGGGGSDTAVFSGNLAAATLGTSTSGEILVTTAGGGTDSLTNVETLEFADQSVVVVGADGFATIQAAVDAATAGDTILVLEGTYNEVVTVDKQLTILGAKGGVDGANAARGSDEAVVDGGFWIQANGVTLDGLMIQDGSTISGSKTGVYVTGDDATLTNMLFERSGGFDGFRGVLTPTGSDESGLTITASKFTGWATGIYSDTDSDFTVTGNTFEANNVGMSADFPSLPATVDGNVFTGNLFEDLGLFVTDANFDVGALVGDSNSYSGAVPQVSVYAGNAGAAQTIDGSDADDQMQIVSASSVEFIGGTGNDVLMGGDNNDILRGGEGDDTLTGGDGNDFLFAGSGNDTLTGATGMDSFRISSNSGEARITDFDPAEVGENIAIEVNINGTTISEFIDLAGRLSVSGGNVIIDLSNGPGDPGTDVDHKVVVEGVSDTSLLASDDFVFFL